MDTQQYDLTKIGRVIDVSAVRTDVTLAELDHLVSIARHYNCICTFAMPCFTEYLVEQLRDTPQTMVGGVVGFPSGADTTPAKVFMAKELIAAGCRELDMVIQVGALKSGQYERVSDDIRAVVAAAEGIPVKTILEISYLTDEEIVRASELAVAAGAAFVKTGTGWAPKATTLHTIQLIKRTVGDAAQVKAAGGVRDLDTLLQMMAAGCNRFGIGIRSAVTILEEAYRRAGAAVPVLTAESSRNDTY